MLLLTLFPAPCHAQNYPSITGGTASPVDIPQTNLTPIPRTPPPPSGMGTPLFDPYNSGRDAGAYAPAMSGAQPVTPSASYPGWLSGSLAQSGSPPTFGPGNPGFSGNPGYSGQAQGSGGLGQPVYNNQPYASPTLPPSGYPPEAYPSTIYPSGSPTSLFPGGFYQGGGMPPISVGGMQAFRLLQGPRFQHGWINGGDGATAVGMNETDVSLVFAFPNFCYSGQPVLVSPGFGLNLLSGPHGSTGADLPGQVYSAYLDADWQSDPNRIFGLDMGLRVGMFSDFDTNIGDSFRVLGRGLALFRLTPYSTIKGGVHYISRNKIKLLPAFGWLYTPRPTTRYDFFFPEPKLSHYVTTLGTQDVWTYVGGEYGGGSWTVGRDSGQSERVDINDIRLLLGFEWGRNDLLRAGRRTGFFEVGYVFQRELIYRENPADNLRPSDSVMLRVGLGY